MTETTACPVGQGRDDRKSGALAAAHSHPAKGSVHVRGFDELRRLFRSAEAVQGMPGAKAFGSGSDPDHMPVFFLDGEPHRRRRQAIAQYFTPRAITGRYHEVIERTCDAIVTQLRRDGSGPLDLLAFKLAVDVTADVIGLTESESDALARRLRTLLDGKLAQHSNPLIRVFGMARVMFHLQRFNREHVQPAVKARRSEPRHDVISHMIRENYSKRAMLLECMIYGTAGMVTTRELITMACWHMLEDDDLRQRYLAGSEDDQFAIVEEILRLEPVAGMLYRKVPSQDGGETMYTLDIRAANFDEALTGPCPYQLDPDRPKRAKANRQFMSFGDGAHRCPGAQLALHEARIFLDRILRLPGIRLVGKPRFEWSKAVMGYELRDAVIACDRA